MYLIRNEGYCCPIEMVPEDQRADVGCFVAGYHDTPCGRGMILFSADPRFAMQFATAGEAAAFWKTQSRTVPLRPDGTPNRPMTAFTALILTVEEATATRH